MDKNIASLIGLCQRAGKIVTGEESCEKALRNGSAKLVIISEDASQNTKKKFVNKSFYYNVKALVFGSRADLNKAMGKMNRTTIIITEENLAKKLEERIQLEMEKESKE